MTNITFLRDIVAAYGGTLDVFTFEGGRALAIMLGPGIVFRGEAQDGDERRLYNDAHRWLDSQPWPTEDDPRV